MFARFVAGRSRTAIAASFRRFGSSRTQVVVGRRYAGRRLAKAVAVSGALGFVGLYSNWRLVQNDAQVNDNAEGSVEVHPSLTPFPTLLGPPEYQVQTLYSLLGYAVRKVTFMQFKVYGLGIYVAEGDKHLIPEILSTNFLSKTFIDTDETKSHAENVREALDDPVKSLVLLENLLDGGMRMMAKVTPIRNTNFHHLRDGLTKAILNHPDVSEDDEDIMSGLEELREVFGKGGPIAKDDELLIELAANSSLKFTHHSRKKDKFIEMGHVDRPALGKLLFTQYMGGPVPLSPDAKESVTSHIVSIIEQSK